MAQPSPSMSPQQLNAMQRSAVLAQSIEMVQQIYSQSVAPTGGSVITVNPRAVGLTKRFYIIVSGTITNPGAGTAHLTRFGLQNIFQNLSFTDLNNNLRVNTAGWHLANVITARERHSLGEALQESAFSAAGAGADVNESQAGEYGANYPVIVSPQAITTATASPFRMVYELPLAYADDDLTGSVWLNVVNSVAQLQMVFNLTPFVATAGVDDTFAVATGTVPGLAYSGNVTVSVYQVYLDQIPRDQNGNPILPIIDISTVYELKSTTLKGITVGQDFPYAYANFRRFLSTFTVYNSAGDDTDPADGSNVNYWALQSANFTNIFKYDPLTASMFSRRILGKDFPGRSYYFSHRRKPLNTTQYGNLELILNPSAAAAGAYLAVGVEDFALQNVLTQASSLAAG